MHIIPESKLITYLLLLISAILATHALMFTKAVLMPFVFSVFVYSAFAPFSKFFEYRLRVPHWLANVIGGCLILSTLLIIVLTLGYSFNSFVQGADIYKDKMVNLLGFVQSLSAKYGWDLNPQHLQAEIRNLPLLDWVKNFTGGFFSLIGNVVLISIFTLFLLMGDNDLAQTSEVMREVQIKISKYVTAKIVISLVTASLVGIVLVLFDVELAFLFTILTFLLNFIPNVGSILAVALPLPILLLQYGLGVSFWLVLVLTASIQMIIGNILEPKFMGESMNLHPITILLMLMFWGVVWGVPGMFLAVPITAILRIVFLRFEVTQPIAQLMAESRKK